MKVSKAAKIWIDYHKYFEVSQEDHFYISTSTTRGT